MTLLGILFSIAVIAFCVMGWFAVAGIFIQYWRAEKAIEKSIREQEEFWNGGKTASKDGAPVKGGDPVKGAGRASGSARP